MQGGQATRTLYKIMPHKYLTETNRNTEVEIRVCISQDPTVDAIEI